MGSVGNGNGAYSDVDRRYTPISARDKRIVAGDGDWGGWDTRFFQTANAFHINRDLRDGDPERLKDPTVQAMDRNMLPTNKDMQVARLVGSSFLDGMLKNATRLGFLDRDNAIFIQEVVEDSWRYSSFEIDSVVRTLNSMLSGASFVDKGFMSATYNLTLDDSAFGDRPIRLDMNIPKGTRGMFSPTGEESEFVVHRGSQNKIHSVEYDYTNNKFVFNLTTR